MTIVQKPTTELVRNAVAQHDREHALAEQALDELVRQYPRNGDLRHVLLKVVAVNSLGHTHVFDVEAVARHIHEEVPELDAMLKAGSPDAVHQIAKLAIHGKNYNLYSFATKYCARHNAGAYAIYDLRIEHYLCALHSAHGFGSFNHTDLCDYPKYLHWIDTLRDAFGLGKFSYTEIGKFLMLQGEPPARVEDEPAQAGPGAFDFYPAEVGAAKR
jgi:hypothetical protein